MQSLFSFITLIYAIVFTQLYSKFLLLGRNFRVRMSSLNMAEAKPIEQAMHKKITNDFQPVHLEIINESYMHNVPKGSETHFKVVVVSNKFDALSLVQRHRLVNSTLQFELKNGVHALSIVVSIFLSWAIFSFKFNSSTSYVFVGYH